MPLCSNVIERPCADNRNLIGWRILDTEVSQRAVEAARAQRNDLQLNAGTAFASVVDHCLTAKDVEWEHQARAAYIYKKVVVPLEKLVSELIWD